MEFARTKKLVARRESIQKVYIGTINKFCEIRKLPSTMTKISKNNKLTDQRTNEKPFEMTQTELFYERGA